MQCDVVCVLCDNPNQSATHLLLKCPFAADILRDLTLMIDLQPILCETALTLIDYALTRVVDRWWTGLKPRDDAFQHPILKEICHGILQKHGRDSHHMH